MTKLIKISEEIFYVVSRLAGFFSKPLNAFQVTTPLRLNDFSTHRVAFERPSLSLLVNGQTHLSTGRG